MRYKKLFIPPRAGEHFNVHLIFEDRTGGYHRKNITIRGGTEDFENEFRFQVNRKLKEIVAKALYIHFNKEWRGIMWLIIDNTMLLDFVVSLIITPDKHAELIQKVLDYEQGKEDMNT